MTNPILPNSIHKGINHRNADSDPEILNLS